MAAKSKSKSKSFSYRERDEWLLACISQQAQGESLSDSQVIVIALKHYFSDCEHNPEDGTSPESGQVVDAEASKPDIDLLNFE